MKTKDEIRQRIWKQLTDEKNGRFPFPLINRIPNFKGAEKAATYITTLPEYKLAKVIKVNPDSPQLPLRKQILLDGKTLLVPTPRLKAGFIIVKPEWVPAGEERRAASLSHIKSYGKEIPLTEIPQIDLMVVGSVAIHQDGRRIGKGEGYADREYAILMELGNPPVTIVTSIHSTQLVPDDIPRDTYDLTVDWIATEEGIVKTNSPYEKPTGIEWKHVSKEEMEEMPVLQQLWDLKYKQT
ncbi:5-formyltetrahydrofolate cyclo-ligase [Metabacillus crassostreae]|uniref:5-formyltetrahydrofolate cyclo-ligase n=1 Tax=Metabacillus crassostreae TaxID=929098 RepID=UPI001959912E|nr:5-formyltetrahydrofolate cyclo-ligase [Metabacillus crassostreae]MBM7604992.1 5-formyltetrahydrofolate cyclo-ligase [Metabacillus crassostreae]